MTILNHIKKPYWTLRSWARGNKIILNNTQNKAFFEGSGYCPNCNQQVRFTAKFDWFRDHLLCSNCGCVPRERALSLTIENNFPNWREMIIHESSPGNRGTSLRLAKDCPRYIPSQYFPDKKLGTMINTFRNENLEALTLADESVDLHITQDVLEHVFEPTKVFKEIARTLKPGGAHIFTVPIVNKYQSSSRRAVKTNDGQISHLEPAAYHGNPISDQGSLVTIDWGYDICQHIFESSGLFTQLIYIDDISKGIRAEYIEVFISFKSEIAPKAAIPRSI